LIRYIYKNCTGCRICEIICSLEHYKEINTCRALIRYKDDWPKIGRVDFCRQCPKRNCVTACPEDALFVDEGDFVKIDSNKCIGCLACSEACPFGILPLDGNDHPLFCDTCLGKFQCVEWCPTKALKKAGEQ
jgi:anaerobic carbon-monoxide dehydrogenase iron sulfur subunit